MTLEESAEALWEGCFEAGGTDIKDSVTFGTGNGRGGGGGGAWESVCLKPAVESV